ncbi:rhomboid family intramembrane serine protease [Parvularcula marina]|uniref:rhomboid family intramembrane serine protease n=2 Tax=Parvularcula marina TaxID=2292771 RepID=UPI0035167D47
MNDQIRWHGQTTGRESQLGRPPAREPIISAPGVITALVLMNSLIFLAQNFLPAGWIMPILDQLAFFPALFTAGMKSGADPFGLALPIFGHIFLHADIIHIVFNMMWLIVFGTGVARRMGTDWGPPSERAFRTGLFLTFYLICGLGGVLAYYLVQPDSPYPVIGASGAISGMMGAAMRFVVPTRELQRDPTRLAPIFSRPIIVVTLAFVLMNLATAIGLGAGGYNIAWEAHLGGYFTGLLLFPLFDVAIRKARSGYLG